MKSFSKPLKNPFRTGGAFLKALSIWGPICHFLNDHVVDPACKSKISCHIVGIDTFDSRTVCNPNPETRIRAVSGLGLMTLDFRSRTQQSLSKVVGRLGHFGKFGPIRKL